jgi:hypothetical protein
MVKSKRFIFAGETERKTKTAYLDESNSADSPGADIENRHGRLQRKSRVRIAHPAGD